MKEIEITIEGDLIEERLILGKLSKAKAEQLEKRTREESRQVVKETGEIDNEMRRLEENKAKYGDKTTTEYDYDNMTYREQYDIVHEVFNNIFLSRDKGTAIIEFHNNYNRNIDIIKYNAFKKKFI